MALAEAVFESEQARDVSVVLMEMPKKALMRLPNKEKKWRRKEQLVKNPLLRRPRMVSMQQTTQKKLKKK